MSIGATTIGEPMTEKSIPSARHPIHTGGMDSDLDGLGHRLALTMERAGLSQGEVSRRTGMRPETISRYVGGGTPRVGELVKLAHVLGVSVDWLLGTERDERDPDPDVAAFIGRSPDLSPAEMAYLRSQTFKNGAPTEATFHLLLASYRSLKPRD